MSTPSTTALVVDRTADRPDALAAALSAPADGPAFELITRSEVPTSLSPEVRPVSTMVVSLEATDAYPSELVHTLMDRWPWLAVIVMDAPDSPSLAVEIMKAGAFTVLGADASTPDDVAAAIREATAHSVVAHRQDPLAPPVREEKMIGASEAMGPVFRHIGNAAGSGMRVLIHGESGTGKTLAARTIHAQSNRPDAPFLRIDGRARLAEEAETLFPARPTGPEASRDTLFDVPVGTVLLDHVDDMTAPVQRRLARALEALAERRGRQDLRIIGTVGALPLSESMRTDLYYQLAGLPIGLPPLRERGADVRALAEHFLKAAPGEASTLADDAAARLQDYDWPGNVRQLRNVIVHAAALASDAPIRAEHIVLPDGPVPTSAGSPSSSTDKTDPEASAEAAPAPGLSEGATAPDASSAGAQDPFDRYPTLEEVKRSAVKNAYERHDGDVDRAALDLDIGRSTFYRMLDRYGLKE